MTQYRYTPLAKKPRPSRKGGWDDKIKDKGVDIFLSSGSMAQVSRELGIPYYTVIEWKGTKWWDEKIKNRREEATDKLDVKLTKALELAIDGVTDRIENGDTIIDPRTGKERTMPAKMRDLTNAFNVIMDKRQVLRREPTKIVEQHTTAAHLQQLADQFSQFVTGKIKAEPKVIESEAVEFDAETETYFVNEDKTNAVHDQWKEGLQEGVDVGTQEKTQ